MLTTTRARITALVATAAMSLAGAGVAQAATEQNGLVNVSLTDTTIQVPVAVAANVCDVQANVIAANNLLGDFGDCESISRANAKDSGGGGGSTKQTGLVNVSLTDTTIQVPIGIAANVCDVQANVLAAGNVLLDEGECDAISRVGAQA